MSLDYLAEFMFIAVLHCVYADDIRSQGERRIWYVSDIQVAMLAYLSSAESLRRDSKAPTGWHAVFVVFALSYSCVAGT